MQGRVERALVTGATSGIGRAFADELAWRGVALTVVARRRFRLDELAERLPVDVEVLRADLTDPDERRRVEARLAADEDPIDLLVNSAGVGAYGRFEQVDADRQAAMVELNCTAVLRLARAVLPQQVARGAGGVINVGSTAGYLPGPHGAAYGATKAFVRSLSEALYEEVRGTGVHVMLTTPGFIWTEFQGVAGVDPARVPGLAWSSAAEVAAAALRDFGAGRAVSVAATPHRVLATLADVVPSSVTRRVNGAILRRLAATGSP